MIVAIFVAVVVVFSYFLSEDPHPMVIEYALKFPLETKNLQVIEYVFKKKKKKRN